MVTEREILEGFLVDRTNFQDGISKASFKKCFPRGTSQDLIDSVYKHLRYESKRSTNLVIQNLDKFEDSRVESQKRLEASELKQLKENNSLKQINTALDQISKILDDELASVESKRQAELEKLKNINNHLKDLVIPSTGSYPDLQEEVSELLSNLKELLK